MASKFTAKLYFDEKVFAEEDGEDADELYNWMLIKAQGKFGNLSGKIIDNKTKKIVRRFRKSPPD